MGGSKNVKKHNEKKGSLQYIKGTKFKNQVMQNDLANYIKWKP